MTIASADRLLRDLDALPYPRRMHEVALAARAAAGRGDLPDLLEGLERHGTHGRRLAAAAAVAGLDKGYLASRLTDPDPVVRRRAQRAAHRAGVGDYALQVALEDAPAVVRREILATIVEGRRTALAEQLIDPHRALWGDREAAALLPACGAERVARDLPELFAALSSWHAMTRHHPDALLEEAERQLDGLPPALRHGWWARHAAGMARAVAVRPGRVLDLLERYHTGALPTPLWQRLSRLAAARPEGPARVVRLLLAPDRAGQHHRVGLPRNLLRRLVRHHLPDLTQLAELARAWAGDPELLAELLRALPPSRRAELHDAARQDAARQDGARDDGARHDSTRPDAEGPDPTAARPAAGDPWADDRVLELLPHARRHAEARRLARHARERQLPPRAELAALAHLPPPEARPALLAALAHPEADERAAAWRLLILNAARSADPAAVGAVLADAERLRNEQDPVRSAALDALAAVHPRLFTDASVDHLDHVVAEAIAARDSSARTRHLLGQLAGAVLREHAVTAQRDLVGWSLRTIVRLSGHTGGADLGRLDRTLRSGQEHQVFTALLPWLEAGAEKVDHGLTFALARAVGRRAAGMPELQELLRQAILFGNDATVRTAVELWLADPATRDERVAEILVSDPSAAVLGPVLRVLTTRRTDLLDVALDSTPPYGRFLKEPARWLPPLGRAVHRWLPRQQRAAARRYAREAADASAPTRQRAAAIAALADVPEVGVEEIRRWVGSPDTALAEAALAALARTERPGEALPELLAHAGDERARVALYAAGRAARQVPPGELAERLRDLLLPAAGRPAKVTSRKEAARLAARLLPAPRAAALLAEVYDRPGEHRDVRAACVAAATRLLGQEQAWRILDDAARPAGPAGADAVDHGDGAGDPDRSALHRAVLRVVPFDLPEHHRARYARLVTGLSATRDRELAAAVHGALRDWGPWAPEATRVLAWAVADTSTRGTWRSAAHALAHLALTAPGPRSGLLSLLDHLAAADGHDDTPDAEVDADRPSRARVRLLARQLAASADRRPAEARTLAAEAGEVLARHPTFVPDAAQLLLAAVDLDAEPVFLQPALARLAILHHGRPALAAATARALRRRLAASPATPADPGTLLAVARELAAEGAAATGQFAVELVRAGGGRSGWSPAWRELVRVLRRHPVPDVRDAALVVSTARA
ncbi:hypothetical protein ACTWP5_13345 [Streptomyces sp. 4N509B]|uniref:hypothetical protein n=1 Tax=Streptomyces sp. 4N509B TaxID=3457413 RepID=UPI003FD62368